MPAETTDLDLKSPVIAWKDTRETRRAVSDALPLLKLTVQVAVVEIAPDADISEAFVRLRDVAGWLERHGIAAAVLPQATNGHEMEGLHRMLEDRNCDLVIAGAFGHARLWEWAFGGVTQNLLLSPDRCVLRSH